MILRYVICAGLLLCIMFSGCGKKKKEEAPDSSLQTTPTLSEKDSSDEEMFNEFYEDSAKESSEPMDDFSGPSSTPQFDPDGRYVVQVSCVLSQGFAESVASKLESKGYPSYVAEVINPTPDLQGTYYRIRVGGFNGVSIAKAFAEDYLVNDGYEYWVDNRSNDNIGMGGSGLGETSTSEYESYSSPEPQTYTQPAPVAQPVETQPSAPVQEVKETVPSPVTTQPEVIPPATTTPATQPSTTPVETKEESAEDDWGDDDWADDTTSW